MTNLTGTQNFGRAQNAIGSFFDRKLVVPKIFFDANWDGSIAHVLAIDRAGVGDVHFAALSAEIFQASPDGFDFVFSSELQTLVSQLLVLRTQVPSSGGQNKLYLRSKPKPDGPRLGCDEHFC